VTLTTTPTPSLSGIIFISPSVTPSITPSTGDTLRFIYELI
jgi:hypothetical protein